jgi:hypothetical protein
LCSSSSQLHRLQLARDALLQFGAKLGLHLSAVLLFEVVVLHQTSNFDDGGGCDDGGDDDDDDDVFLSMKSETRREFQMVCIYRMSRN